MCSLISVSLGRAFDHSEFNNPHMTNKQVIFSDRMVGLSLQNGLVRLDLAVNVGTAKDTDDKPAQRMEVTTQVVMPLDAFANAVAMQQNLLKQAIEQSEKQRAQVASA